MISLSQRFTWLLPVFVLAACDNTPASKQTAPAAAAPASAPQAAAPKASGEHYTVISQPYYAPFATRGERGEIIGLDVDLLNAIAERQGFTLTFMPHEMTGLLETVNNGKADIVATGVNITPERQKIYDFSEPYLEASWAALADKTKNNFSSFAELKGQTVAVQKDSLSQTQLLASPVATQILPVTSVYLGVSSVAKGNAAAVYDVDTVLSVYLKEKNHYLLIDKDAARIPFGFVLKKGNSALKAKLDKGLADIRADGTYQKIVDKWIPKQEENKQ